MLREYHTVAVGADMEDRKLLKLIYTLFLGVLVALFVGVGINTFYPGPKQPEYPVALNSWSKEPTPEQIAQQKVWDKRMADHNRQMKPYNRNVSIIALSIAVVLLVISVVLHDRIKLMSDGVLVGGLLTLLYSIGRGFASEDSRYVFAAITVGLVIVLYTGYRQFIKIEATTTAHKQSDF